MAGTLLATSTPDRVNRANAWCFARKGLFLECVVLEQIGLRIVVDTISNCCVDRSFMMFEMGEK